MISYVMNNCKSMVQEFANLNMSLNKFFKFY